MALVFPNIQVNGFVRGTNFLYRASVLVFDNSLTGKGIAYSAPTLTLSALTAGSTVGTLDGVEPNVDDRILLTDCGNATPGVGVTGGKEASFNGIWTVTGGTTTTLTLIRALDWDEGDSVIGVTIPIIKG